eukprot:CAMPEP_0176171230 /NCGR_PEP_ID=MMETSP0120_2-20121206/87655_1 /TAXON_ID=160619 /ORGANISM="Kryptoperidinium foliaceum, Strain CCMP 1326" /LENGTH=492 /DNA_ID=CAMNT_0017509043 /DNA_START=54 /DNA_END=1528 /DNA_ORIENTATION=-
MALFGAAELLGSAMYETASLFATEVAMFGLAALCYVMFLGGLPLFGKAGKPPGQKKGIQAASRASAGGGVAVTAPSKPSAVQSEVRTYAARGEWRSVSEIWHRVKCSDEALQLDLAAVVEAMRRLGSAPGDVAEELRAAATARPQLIDGIAGLPKALAQGESRRFLDAILALLERLGRPADASAYAALMDYNCSRRRPEDVAAVAARVPGGALTPSMRGLLATAAAQSGRLGEALEQLRQVPTSGPGLVAPGAVAQILALACAEGSMDEAVAEMKRLALLADARKFDELLSNEATRTDRRTAQLQRLLNAGAALGVPLRPSAFQVIAAAAMRDGDGPGLCALCDKLEETSKGADGVAVSEPLSLAMISASCTVGDLDVAAAGAGDAPGGLRRRPWRASAQRLLLRIGRDFFEAEMLPRSLALDSALAATLGEAAREAGRHELVGRLPSLVPAPPTRRAPNRAQAASVQPAEVAGTVAQVAEASGADRADIVA